MDTSTKVYATQIGSNASFGCIPENSPLKVCNPIFGHNLYYYLHYHHLIPNNLPVGQRQLLPLSNTLTTSVLTQGTQYPPSGRLTWGLTQSRCIHNVSTSWVLNLSKLSRQSLTAPRTICIVSTTNPLLLETTGSSCHILSTVSEF